MKSCVIARIRGIDSKIRGLNRPYDIRRVIYTTNTIEGYHRQLRKVTKTKSAYPSDEALKKIIYLATMDATKKWNMPLREWKKCISQFHIYYGDRLSLELAL